MTSLRQLAILKSPAALHSARFTIIALGLVAVAANTVPDWPPVLALAWRLALWACLVFCALDWARRAVIAMRAGRTRPYWLSDSWLVDALAVLPVPIALIIGVPPATAWLLGSLWLFKLAAASPGLARVRRVIRQEAPSLASVLLLFLIVLFLAGVALHLLERDLQPTAFGNLPSALWWAVVTLSTTGYGDAVPVTLPGRLIAGSVMICGIGVFGLLTGILATGFVEDSRRENFVQNWQLVNNVPFFRVLEPAGIIEISHMLRRWEVARGVTIMRRGQQGDCMYFIASGEVEVKLAPHPVRLGPGAFFGELALLGDGTRNATVVAAVPTTLLILGVADFRMFTARNAALASAIEAEAGRRGDRSAPLPAAPQPMAGKRIRRAARAGRRT